MLKKTVFVFISLLNITRFNFENILLQRINKSRSDKRKGWLSSAGMPGTALDSPLTWQIPPDVDL